MGLQLPWIWEPTGLQNQLVPSWFFVGSLLVFLLVFLWFPVGFSLNPRWFPLVSVGFEVKGFRFTYIGRIKTQEKSLKNQFYVSLSLVC
jgi:hypothetical protein